MLFKKSKRPAPAPRNPLALHESERQRAARRYEQPGESSTIRASIARNDVLKAEDALAQAIVRSHEDKRWLAETDMVITESRRCATNFFCLPG